MLRSRESWHERTVGKTKESRINDVPEYAFSFLNLIQFCRLLLLLKIEALFKNSEISSFGLGLSKLLTGASKCLSVSVCVKKILQKIPSLSVTQGDVPLTL